MKWTIILCIPIVIWSAMTLYDVIGCVQSGGKIAAGVRSYECIGPP